ncbi:hypothetical protein [Aliterella atlantica]|uniref:Uncharacterized protein n=1 Tax=Aliterella atlantica CENA595 TaxID=1618023 RepID=A0A0D8ZQX1_9CYAN|nr:hypothetical protein [Aliterella atlantica]KJH70732.1 hypothetical protein UH38_16445 [Aliterella atlantica CENA595]
MKSQVKKRLPKHPHRLASALFLTGILSLSSSSILVQNATAVTQATKGELIADRGSDDSYDDRGRRGRGSDNYEDNRGRRNRGSDNYEGDRGRRRNSSRGQLPARLANAVILDLSKRTGIAPGRLQVTQSSRQTWSDGCLGLARPDEICTQALVDGWRVVVSNNRRTWVYRTDSTGRVLRLQGENSASNTNKLPNSIARAVLRNAARQLNVSTSQVEVVRAQRRNWSDSCLGLGRLDYQCAAEIVPGWLVTVESGRDRLVYRTGDMDSAIVLDEAASSFDNNASSEIRPVEIPRSQLPPDLESDEVFRAIASGGIAGRTYETILFADGRVVRVLVSDRNNARPQTYQISRQQVRQFERLLQQQRFEGFDGLSYPPSRGTADFMNVTLTSQRATTSYTDINQDRLPRSLQSVIQAWNQIASDRI